MMIVRLLSAGILICSVGGFITPASTAAKTAADIGRPSEQATHGCADFLTQLGKKPAHVEYVGCRYLPSRQGKPLQATYRVSGRYAAATEVALIKTAGLHRLRHSCCQWDAPAGQFKDRNGREFSIDMGSGETIVGSRAQWSQIKTFEIIVESFTEDI